MTDARPLSDQACSAGFGFVSHLVLSLLPALAGCASADQGCVPTMAGLRIGMTKPMRSVLGATHLRLPKPSRP